MAKWLKNILLVIGILFLVFLYAGFQSYVTKSLFIVSLYDVFSALITEAWKLISAPTVFIAILIFLILLVYRTRIESVFPAIKEITAGNISAKFDFKDINKTEEVAPTKDLPVPLTDSNNVQKSDNNGDSETKMQEDIISLLSDSFCKVVLSLDDKLLTTDEFIQKLDEEGVFNKNIKTNEKDKRYLFFAGVFRTFWIFVVPNLISYKSSEDFKTAHFNLKPGIKELIERRLTYLEQSSSEKAKS